MRRLVPRPDHEETSWEEQEAWKKKLTSKTQTIQIEHPDANVEVWTMDEHRLGLKPVLRTLWAPSGEQPIAHDHQLFLVLVVLIVDDDLELVLPQVQEIFS